MKKIYQDTTFYLIVFIISYFLYIYPFEILNELLFKETTSRRTSLYYTFLVSVLVIFYFRSRYTFLPLKLFVYEGMELAVLDRATVRHGHHIGVEELSPIPLLDETCADSQIMLAGEANECLRARPCGDQFGQQLQIFPR